MKLAKFTIGSFVVGFVIGTVGLYSAGAYDDTLWSFNRDNVYKSIKADVVDETTFNLYEADASEFIISCMTDSFVDIAKEYQCSYSLFNGVNANIEDCSLKISDDQGDYKHALSVMECVIADVIDDTEDVINGPT